MNKSFKNKLNKSNKLVENIQEFTKSTLLHIFLVKRDSGLPIAMYMPVTGIFMANKFGMKHTPQPIDTTAVADILDWTNEYHDYIVFVARSIEGETQPNGHYVIYEGEGYYCERAFLSDVCVEWHSQVFTNPKDIADHYRYATELEQYLAPYGIMNVSVSAVIGASNTPK